MGVYWIEILKQQHIGSSNSNGESESEGAETENETVFR